MNRGETHRKTSQKGQDKFRMDHPSATLCKDLAQTLLDEKYMNDER